MNKKYQLVSDILNEGIGSFITKTVPRSFGKAMGKFGKAMGNTPEKFKKTKDLQTKMLHKIGIHPKNRKMTEFEIGVHKGLK